MLNGKPLVLIFGGGFGGMYAALEFERAPARGAKSDVTLVNHDNFFLFTPILHEVAASDLDITNIVSPIRKLLRRVVFFHGEIEAINAWGCRMGTRTTAIPCRTTTWSWHSGPPRTSSISQA